jgi:hypothetical protein
VTQLPTGPYLYGDTVQLTAVPEIGWRFSAWSGDVNATTNPQSLTLTGNTSITALFVPSFVQTPAIPSLISPSNNWGTWTSSPLLDWHEPIPAAAYYRIQVASNGNFVTPEIDRTRITLSEFTPAAPLEPGQVYFWHVQAYNSYGEASDWSDVRSFRVLPASPSLSTPADRSSLQSLRPNLTWSEVDGATFYTIQISKSNSFAQLEMADTVFSSSFTPKKDLLSSSTYYWRVRAESPAGPSVWSQGRSFTTPNPPGTPSLISPKNDTIASGLQPAFSWSKASTPRGTTFDHYQIQIAANSSFAAPVVDVNVSGIDNTRYSPATALTSYTKYFWRVRAVNTTGDVSSWSTVLFFQTPPTRSLPWRIGTFSTSGKYINWESRYTLDETLPAPLAAEGRTFPDWNDVPNATGYIIQVSNEPTFSAGPFVASATTVESSYKFTRTLTPGTTVYWRVLAIGGGSVSNWSEISSFLVP